MPFIRGEIIEVNFPLAGPHPGIIISGESVYKLEGVYYCVMITHDTRQDIFSYPLRKEMYIDPEFFHEGQQVRTHLISMVKESEIGHCKGIKIKPHYVNELVDRIKRNTFV